MFIKMKGLINICFAKFMDNNGGLAFTEMSQQMSHGLPRNYTFVIPRG